MVTLALYALRSQSSLSRLGAVAEIIGTGAGLACAAELEATKKYCTVTVDGIKVNCQAEFIGIAAAANNACRVELWKLTATQNPMLQKDNTARSCEVSYPFLLLDCSQPEAVKARLTAKDAKALQGLTVRAGGELFTSILEHDPPLAYTFTYYNIQRWFE